ncbi:two-component sensor histidine kinase [Campylobacter concisus]|uniref:histidine kinase n=1 Tax=Campylobacter concisus TaxID=199 RepID=A0A1Y5N1V4_9BACT|nr:HAMP domain-containing sensor histidine kinase [Campylobacter concisus]OUT11965.1 two-component sensor histidine kinase [Campylobacter concisus]
MSEKTQILFKILSLYLVSSVLFLSYFFIHDYQNKKEALILNEVKSLKEIKMGIYMKARMSGLGSVSSLTNEKGVHACIVLENGEKIYKDFECKNINKGKNVNLIDGKVAIFEKIQYMEDNATDELARANIFLVGKNINGEILSLQISTTLKAAFFLFALLFVALYLAKLSLRPLYEKIDTLNRFIKDSTHEINTPLSVISMSIETADLENLNDRNLKRFNNISLAAKNLSGIYDTLVHLCFNLNKPIKKEIIDLKLLVSQKINYFSPFFAKRGLKIDASLKPSFINADLEDMGKILDNLLSNVAKYAEPNTEVGIILEQNFFSITNLGHGISKEQQMQIFDRYTRFNDDQGGFGIGLSLVKSCCIKNGIEVKCQSELGKETTFSLSWKD